MIVQLGFVAYKTIDIKQYQFMNLAANHFPEAAEESGSVLQAKPQAQVWSTEAPSRLPVEDGGRDWDCMLVVGGSGKGDTVPKVGKTVLLGQASPFAFTRRSISPPIQLN